MINESRSLRNKQSLIMREYSFWEALQTNWSHDEDFFHFCQRKLDKLDREAEQLRVILEGGRHG